MNELPDFGITLTMIYLDMFQLEEKRGHRAAKTPETARTRGPMRIRTAGRKTEPKRLPAQDEEEEVLLFTLPSRLRKKPGRLAAKLEILSGRYPPRGLCWYDEELRRMLDRTFWRIPVPEAAWIHRFWQQEEFCPNLILIPPDSEETDFDRQLESETRWAKEVLQDGYGRLNGLLVLSGALAGSTAVISLMERQPYYREIYEDTGLPAICAGSLEKAGVPAKWGGTICLDARSGFCIPHRGLPEGTLYLDMTSEERKARLLAAKRKDICYRSALNCLDTYVRTRYNTNRCK